MDYDVDQLRALDAAVSEGTLEAAARVLHVTPSAVSQRLKALEIAAGRVLLVRSKPVRVTASGEIVLRLARQVEALVLDTTRALQSDSGAGPFGLALAVNADSLATWVLPALAPFAGSIVFDLHRADQDHTGALLRDGSVMAAITTQAQPVPGCRVTRLGGMRYRPMATPSFRDQWFPAGVTPATLALAPMVVFDRTDEMQTRYLTRRAGRRLDPPAHFIPSSADFLTAVGLGLGWGMLPDLQSAPLLDTGQVVALDDRGAIDVVLYWQQWRLHSPSLDQVAQAVLAAAREHLR